VPKVMEENIPAHLLESAITRICCSQSL